MLPHFLYLFYFSTFWVWTLFLNFLAPNVLNVRTVMAQRHHLPLGTLLAPNYFLYGTSLAPAWHHQGTLLAQKNLLLYGTFLAPILFRHMNHQSQACSCNWRYFLTGSWFWICTTVEKMLKTALRPPCKTPESVHWQPWGLEYNPAAVGRCGGATTCF